MRHHIACVTSSMSLFGIKVQGSMGPSADGHTFDGESDTLLAVQAHRQRPYSSTARSHQIPDYKITRFQASTSPCMTSVTHVYAVFHTVGEAYVGSIRDPITITAGRADSRFQIRRTPASSFPGIQIPDSKFQKPLLGGQGEADSRFQIPRVSRWEGGVGDKADSKFQVPESTLSRVRLGK